MHWTSCLVKRRMNRSKATKQSDTANGFIRIHKIHNSIYYLCGLCLWVCVWVGDDWRQCHRSLGYTVRKFDAHRAYFECHISQIPQTKQNRLINQRVLVVERRKNIAIRPTISFSSGKQLLKGRLFCIRLKCAFAHSMT